MKIVWYRYGSICEPDLIAQFGKLQVEVIEIQEEMYNKQICASQRVDLVSETIQKAHPVFVCSINFFPAIADVCRIYDIPYVCWTVDSPVLELFSASLLHKTNRIFLFDRAQYETFHPYNPDCIFHLPLAACTDRFDQVMQTISAKDKQLFSHDIAFVGSLYSEKNPLATALATDTLSKGKSNEKTVENPAYLTGFLNGLIDCSLKVSGYPLIEEAMTDAIASSLKQCIPNFYTLPDAICETDRYVAAHYYISPQAAVTERIRTLNTLAEQFDVHLYTRSNTDPLKGVHVHGGVRTLTEMPKVFHLSKINLNMTIKSIQTGLPLRIFDILGCGGFLMTNYQEELTDYFEIGTDLESYSSPEELVDKCRYYLTHDAIREQIAANGHRKVQQSHTYLHRIQTMLQVLTTH